MIETLVPVNLPPGLYRNGTKLDASGRWYDGNLVRWVEGRPRPVGGWQRLEDGDGVPLAEIATTTLPAPQPDIHRTAFAYRTSDGDVTLVFGSAKSVWAVIKNASDQWVRSTPATASALTLGFRVAGTDSFTLELIPADTWSFDNFGNTLVGVLTSDGRLMQRAGTGSSLTAVSGAPTGNKAVVVTPERFVVLLGAGGDVRKVQWADQESISTWTPTAENQAGDFTLQTNGQLMCGARSKSQTLLWTDTDLWSMNYIGGELVYGFQQEGDNCGIISRNAKVVVDTQAYWMGRDNFYRYDGFVQPIPCDVRDYVFGTFSRIQASQIWAMSLAQFGEVWWFYCSNDDAEKPDRYVAFNYRDHYWHFGELERTCGFDAGLMQTPIMVGVDPEDANQPTLAHIFEHETGTDRRDEVPYLESGPITLDKDRVMRIQRVVPDVSALGDAELSIYTSMYPTQSETLHGPYSLANPTDVRLSAKHIRLRVEEATETDWRLGTLQLGVLPQGRR